MLEVRSKVRFLANKSPLKMTKNVVHFIQALFVLDVQNFILTFRSGRKMA